MMKTLSMVWHFLFGRLFAHRSTPEESPKTLARRAIRRFEAERKDREAKRASLERVVTEKMTEIKTALRENDRNTAARLAKRVEFVKDRMARIDNSLLFLETMAGNIEDRVLVGDLGKVVKDLDSLAGVSAETRGRQLDELFGRLKKDTEFHEHLASNLDLEVDRLAGSASAESILATAAAEIGVEEEETPSEKKRKVPEKRIEEGLTAARRLVEELGEHEKKEGEEA